MHSRCGPRRQPERVTRCAHGIPRGQLSAMARPLGSCSPALDGSEQSAGFRRPAHRNGRARQWLRTRDAGALPPVSRPPPLPRASSPPGATQVQRAVFRCTRFAEALPQRRVVQAASQHALDQHGLATAARTSRASHSKSSRHACRAPAMRAGRCPQRPRRAPAAGATRARARTQPMAALQRQQQPRVGLGPAHGPSVANLSSWCYIYFN